MKKPDMPGLPVHMGTKFTWRGNHGVTMASDLGSAVHAVVWSDACDLGLMVRSHKTDRLVLFTLVDRTYDSEGDLMACIYASYEGNFTLAVYND
jgi:hypothetical protein